MYMTQTLYIPVLELQNVKDINLNDIFKFKLAPVPPSMLEENGDKVSLNKKT